MALEPPAIDTADNVCGGATLSTKATNCARIRTSAVSCRDGEAPYDQLGEQSWQSAEQNVPAMGWIAISWPSQRPEFAVA